MAIDATLRAAARRHHTTKPKRAFSVSTDDLHKKVFKHPAQTLIVFLVDASDSMGQGTFARMKAAKGAVLAILAKARLQRHRVAMVAFRDRSAQVVLPPTTSLDLAKQRLQSLPTGGATPFGHGLMTAWQLVQTERRKDAAIDPLLVILSDGEANIPYDDSSPYPAVNAELLRICD